jgi:hypothetical protein
MCFGFDTGSRSLYLLRKYILKGSIEVDGRTTVTGPCVEFDLFSVGRSITSYLFPVFKTP